MTVYFDVDGIVFCGHGVKHEKGGESSFELRHVYLQGNCRDLLPLLKSGTFVDRIEEEAAIAAESPVGGVFFKQRMPRREGYQPMPSAEPVIPPRGGTGEMRLAVELREGGAS